MLSRIIWFQNPISFVGKNRELISNYQKDSVGKKKKAELQKKFELNRSVLDGEVVAYFPRDNNNNPGFDSIYVEYSDTTPICFAYQFIATASDVYYNQDKMHSQILSTTKVLQDQGYKGRIMFVFVVAHPVSHLMKRSSVINLTDSQVEFAPKKTGKHAYLLLDQNDIRELITPTFIPFLDSILPELKQGEINVKEK